MFRLARHPRTGLYRDHVDPRFSPSNQTTVASTDGTGVGIVAECVAAALGYISLNEAATRVLLSLQALLPPLLLMQQLNWIQTCQLTKRQAVYPVTCLP